jgi:uncharacterized protein (TIGR02145 family)
MAENLDYSTGNSWCYRDDELMCMQYGRLYDWNTARSACPTGWHLPSSDEWDGLIKAVGGAYNAGTKLKSKSGWGTNAKGTDDYGFSALPGGIRDNYGGAFKSVGHDGHWWTATMFPGGQHAYYWSMNLNTNASQSGLPLKDGISVRCVANK